MINPRWERNLEEIEAIKREIDRNKDKIEEIKFNNEISEEDKSKRIKELTELNYDLNNEISNLKKPFDQIVKEAKDDLLELYLNDEDERDWAVAWSGGKDSTVVMGMVVDMIKNLPPENESEKYML